MNQSGASLNLKSHMINIDELMEEAEEDLAQTSFEDDMMQTYGLEEKFDSIFINKRLGRPPKQKRTPIDLSLYPEDDAEINAVRLI